MLQFDHEFVRLLLGDSLKLPASMQVNPMQNFGVSQIQVNLYETHFYLIYSVLDILLHPIIIITQECSQVLKTCKRL